MDVDDSGQGSHRSLIINIVAIVALCWYFILWMLGIVGCITGRKRYRLRPRSPLASASASNVPGVSILRPLKGLDTNLFENLESTFTQEYSNFEILLSVDDPNDQALDVVRDLLVKYPNVNARIVICDEVVGMNPKVNNLSQSYKQAKNDILWILDSNVQVDSGVLARSVDALLGPHPVTGTAKHVPSRRIGLVHHVPYASVSGQALGSNIEEAFLNTNHAKMYLAINRVAIDSCVIGKSNMYRRSDVDRVCGDLKPLLSDSPADASRTTGFPAFGRFLAEDNMIAAALWHELGLRHELSCDVAKNVVGSMTVMDYFKRRVRWIRVRKNMVTAATLVEPFTECFMLSMIACWAMNTLWGVPAWLVLVIHYLAWIAVDLDIYESLAGHYLPPEKRWSFLSAWFLRELLALPIWIYGMLGSEVEWRGRQFRIIRNGEIMRATRSRAWWLAFLNRGKSREEYEQVDQDSIALSG